MKRLFKIFLLTVCFSCLLFTTPALSKMKKTNVQIVKALVKQMHKPMKVVRYHDPAIFHRKGKKHVIVEKIVSISNGKKGGWIKGGGYIAYNKKVPKGKKVTSYIIFSTTSNEYDDVLWVVDNNTYR